TRAGQALKSFTYDAANRIASPGYAYDARGNLTASPGRAYAYDGADRLVAVADASAETTIAAYTYDFLNRRTSATEGTATVFFHYDGASPNVIAETAETGATLATYAYDDRGQLHSMVRDGATYYYHANHRGDVVALTDADGDAVNTYAYGPYGEILSAEETVENPYRYAGYRFDEATGLYYLWNRYYDPQTCRFLTRDPYPGELDNPMSMNPYLYCLGDPVNLVDPTGWCAEAAASASQPRNHLTPSDARLLHSLFGVAFPLAVAGLSALYAGYLAIGAGLAMIGVTLGAAPFTAGLSIPGGVAGGYALVAVGVVSGVAGLSLLSAAYLDFRESMR
ncbi:MAG: RHS repeat-associated core domain-containing protein, partial [Coriobacteriia bacterium]|nr:RHS repeat-associated core domain-containing protein [Coriobacteriia bacterium]